MKDLRDKTKNIIRTALREDIGRGDVTTDALFPRDRKARAELLAKEDMILAGSWVFESVFRALGGALEFQWKSKEGARVKRGTRMCRVNGSLKTLLKGERVALNFLQRLSGIATAADKFVRKARKKGTKILDTRKTTPGLRLLEKYAASLGGVKNHRMGLYDSILIKDNHIHPYGSVRNALRAIKGRIKLAKVEIETRNIKEVKEALDEGAGTIMLDNMSAAVLKKALGIIKGRAKTEISGGVNLSNIERMASLGADYISVGALTHSPKSVDISLKIY